MANMPNLKDHRLRVMEAILIWEGELGNARVRQLFGIQTVQASRLLAQFREMMAGRIFEDSRAKVLRLLDPSGVREELSLDDYIHQILANGHPDPYIVDGRIDLTGVQPSIFSVLRAAAAEGSGVVISYASMSNPIYATRTIYPHSLVRVGRRWHARAWCASRNDFRDFALGRIQSATALPEQAPYAAADDAAWNKLVDVRIVPHQALTLEQQQVVRNESFAGMMAIRAKVRACLVQYVIQDLRAAIDPVRQAPPEFQLEVANASALKPYLFQSYELKTNSNSICHRSGS